MHIFCKVFTKLCLNDYKEKNNLSVFYAEALPLMQKKQRLQLSQDDILQKTTMSSSPGVRAVY